MILFYFWSVSKQDEIFMSRALELAKKGQLSVAPNPMVGAVIVVEGRIIGEGFHREYGKAHAEVNAIASVEDQNLLKQATIYVNLEPCSHFGKTPPCADLIIEKEIPRVVICNRDPSEKVAGKGIEKLKTAGIEVIDGILSAEGEQLNKRFFCLHKEKRPYITLKWALSKDDYIGRNPNDKNKADSWITNSLSKQLAHQWRAEEMGILIGKKTALIDNPQLNCREVAGNDPIRFLIDSNLEVQAEANIFQVDGKTVVLNKQKEGRSNRIDYLLVDEEKTYFESLFKYCFENSIHSILVEGGSYTLQSFIDANLWDEARVFKGTKEFGKGIAGPTINGTLIESLQLREDELSIYKNPSL